MENRLIRIAKMFGICLFIILVLSVSVLFNDVRNFRNIDNTDHLSGQRIGVVCGWESDYFLTPRNDITLKRYDTPSDMFMALNYKQVDAIAVDTGLYEFAKTSISNIKHIGDPLDSFMYTFYTKKGSDYEKQMNEFIDYYMKTDEYKEYKQKAYTIDWINSDEYSEPTGTGKVLKVGYCVDYYPGIFLDADGEVKGIESEFIRRFANYYNYQLEWVVVTGENFQHSLINETTDIVSCQASDLYRSEIEYETSKVSMTDGFLNSDIYLLVPDGQMRVDSTKFFDAY